MGESKSIRSRDPIWILQRALSHLMAQGKNFTDDDAVFEIQSCVMSLLRDMQSPENSDYGRAIIRASEHRT